jgi:hypothetical protein
MACYAPLSLEKPAPWVTQKPGTAAFGHAPNPLGGEIETQVHFKETDILREAWSRPAPNLLVRGAYQMPKPIALSG